MIGKVLCDGGAKLLIIGLTMKRRGISNKEPLQLKGLTCQDQIIAMFTIPFSPVKIPIGIAL